MLTKEKILKKIQQHSETIGAYGIKRVGIFGSFVKANQTSKSDIDVLVEFDRGTKTFDNYMDFKFFLEKMFHRKVDLVIRDTLKARIKNKVLSEVKYA
ncbi:MAG: nucleotidyltransferase family protein [Candidatus Omnitrophica bacterium]|nr:nucleotidyltransferase family protein [Candidatus Omnitrophota bacterium]